MQGFLKQKLFKPSQAHVAMKLGRKASGAKYHARRKKRLHERSSPEVHALLGERRTKGIRARGGHIRQITLRANEVNVVKGKKVEKATITNVLETPQNKFYARQIIQPTFDLGNWM